MRARILDKLRICNKCKDIISLNSVPVSVKIGELRLENLKNYITDSMVHDLWIVEERIHP